MPETVTVIGAGMVGISCALELQRRGYRVTLIDRRGFGEEASSGNAGILSYGNVTPLAAPELLHRALRLLFNRETDFACTIRTCHNCCPGWSGSFYVVDARCICVTVSR